MVRREGLEGPARVRAEEQLVGLALARGGLEGHAPAGGRAWAGAGEEGVAAGNWGSRNGAPLYIIIYSAPLNGRPLYIAHH